VAVWHSRCSPFQRWDGWFACLVEQSTMGAASMQRTCHVPQHWSLVQAKCVCAAAWHIINWNSGKQYSCCIAARPPCCTACYADTA
jgi:hypothetical protein